MFELLFVILFSDGNVTKEFWPDAYSTIGQCQDDGWIKVNQYADQVLQKYPAMTGFDIECRRKILDR